MRKTIHYQRLYNDTEAYCGATLHEGGGTTIQRNHTIFRNQATCKNCRRKIQKDAKG
jgi:hypothetical protein